MFVPRVAGGPYVVPATGGTVTPAPMPEPLTEFRQYPTLLPDGRHYLFLAIKPGVGPYAIKVGSLDSSDAKELLQSHFTALYASSGHLIFRRDTSLMAQPFDPRTLELSGAPVKILDSVGTNVVSFQTLFSVSSNGVLVYQDASPSGELVWFDRQGKRLSVALPAAGYNSLCLSADGKHVVYDEADPGSGAVDVWMADSAGSVPTRLTFTAVQDFYPVCAPTGQDIVFASLREGLSHLFRQTTTSPGSEKIVLRSTMPKVPSDLTSSGQLVYIELRPKTNWDILVMMPSGESQTFLATEADERSGLLSRDGRWMTYVSNETGIFEVYAQPFPATGAKWQVSKGGGSQPQWRSDGSELFYVAPDRKLMSVPLKTTRDALAFGHATPLFDTRITNWELTQGTAFAASADGQRFLINTAIDSVRPMTVVLNWTAALRR